MADFNKIVEEEAKDGKKLKEVLISCQHVLMNTEMEDGRHKKLNFQMSKSDSNVINQKLDEVFNKLNYAAKLNIALGFVIRNIKT